MITIKNKDKIINIEGLWRKNKSKKEYDSKKNEIPYPTPYKKKWDKENFIKKLIKIEKILINKKKFKVLYEKNIKNCKICNLENIDNKFYYIKNNYWSSSLLHYILEHNIKPSDEFINLILSYKIHKGQDILNIPAISITKYDKQYLKLTRNHLLIMDALLQHGSYIKRYNDNNKDFRYSEHMGLLDFNNDGLDKIIVSSKTTRVDEHDNEIYQPDNVVEALDYEYFFHTHPATPRPGGRVNEGILYEFPSTNDIFHFIEHYNKGRTQGSIVITPEGIYIIRKRVVNDKKIKIKNENLMEKNMIKYFDEQQIKAIKKYGKEFTTQYFYSKIAQNISYMKNINKKIKKYGIFIEYVPRIRDKKGRWILEEILLPVYVIEPKLK